MICLLAVTLLGGCLAVSNSFIGGGPSHIELTDARGKAFSQVFTQGFISREQGGDWHIVLVDDGVRTPPGQEPGAVLQPVAEPPLRQIVHLHVFWRPSEGAKPNNPAATNSSFDWRILGTGAEQFENALRYQGSAFVAIDGSGTKYAARIRQGDMRLKQAAGNMRDPLGETRFSGQLHLRRDDAVVANLLQQIKVDNPAVQP